MEFDAATLYIATEKAQKYLMDCCQTKDAPMHFELRTVSKDGVAASHRLSTTITPLPAWGWPVLSKEASVKTLQEVINKIDYQDGRQESMCLTACVDGITDHIVFDFLTCKAGCIQAKTSTAPYSNIQIIRRREIVESIILSESKKKSTNRAVVAVSLDSQIILGNDNLLNKHQMYAMDGTNTILWIGTLVKNTPRPTPTDIDEAVNKEIDYTGRRDTVLIVAGDVVDAGDGRALIKNASIVDSAIVNL